MSSKMSDYEEGRPSYKVIYLTFDECEGSFLWCQDMVAKDDIEYMRVDQVSQISVERDALAERVEELKEAMYELMQKHEEPYSDYYKELLK